MSDQDLDAPHPDRYGRILPDRPSAAPGRSTLTGRMPPSARSIARAVAAELRGDVEPRGAAPAGVVQARGGDPAGADVHAIASAGVRGPSSALPHLGAIQAAFGHHDVRGVAAHTGGAAADAAAAIGARAYATGDAVAFAGPPDLHTAAHEAAHVVQQRGGVRLAGGVGRAGDPYERHADAVADLVVRGASAEALLDTMAHRGAAGGAAVQRDGEGATSLAAMRAAIARITDLGALQSAQTEVTHLMQQPLGADQLCPLAIAGAQYPVRASDLPAIATAIDARATEIDRVDVALVAPTTSAGRDAVHVSDAARPTAPASPAPDAAPEGGSSVGADPEAGAMIDIPFHWGSYAQFDVKLFADTSAGGVLGDTGEHAATIGGGGHGGIGGEMGLEETGLLTHALAPHLHAFADSLTFSRTDDGNVEIQAGVQFADLSAGPLRDTHFSLTLLGFEQGAHGWEVHGPSVGFSTALPAAAIAGLLPAAIASRLGGMLGLRFRLEVTAEPNWRGLLEHLGFDLAEEAADATASGAAGGAGAADATMSAGDAGLDASLDAVGDALGDSIGSAAADGALGGEIATGLAAGDVVAGLVAIAPAVLVVGAFAGLAYLVYEGMQPADTSLDAQSSDAEPGVDVPLVRLCHAFDRTIHGFCDGYAAALRGHTAPDAAGAQNGFQAGAAQLTALVSGGHSAADVHAIATQAADLPQRVRTANREAFEAQARQIGGSDARRTQYLVQTVARGADAFIMVPGWHPRRADD